VNSAAALADAYAAEVHRNHVNEVRARKEAERRQAAEKSTPFDVTYAHPFDEFTLSHVSMPIIDDEKWFREQLVWAVRSANELIWGSHIDAEALKPPTPAQLGGWKRDTFGSETAIWPPEKLSQARDWAKRAAALRLRLRRLAAEQEAERNREAEEEAEFYRAQAEEQARVEQARVEQDALLEEFAEHEAAQRYARFKTWLKQRDKAPA
jgi:hypothetical protein